MLVAILIFSIGIGGFSMLFIRSWRANSFVLEEGMTSMQAARAVRQITAQLRDIRQSDSGEYMVKLAAADELVVYRDEDDDEGIERVRYYLDGADDTFKKGVAEYNGTAYPADYSGDTITDLALYVVNADNSEPLFRYYDNVNAEIAEPATPTTVRLIELNLWINIKPLTAPENVRIGTTVQIRNLDEAI